MKKYIAFSVILVLAIAGLVASQNVKQIRLALSGYAETPQSFSTTGTGLFSARVGQDGESIEYELTYSGTESTVTQAHIHFGERWTSGGIAVFLCSNLGNGPAGTQACPAEGTITGTIRAADVIGPVGQGIAAGEFDELLAAVRAGATYVNVHTVNRGSGEIRAQIESGHLGHAGH